MNFKQEIMRELREDHAWRDRTSQAFVPKTRIGTARIVANDQGIASGVFAAADAFRLRDKRCVVRVKARDGSRIHKGQVLLEVRGPLRSILSAERTALNVATHLSGIATFTNAFVRHAGRDGVEILDTRKTLPGLRDMQKWAVRCGGGRNHRRDLSSAILIKENHLAAVQSEKDLMNFFRKVRALQRRGMTVEMECQNQKEVLWGLFSRADILLLDNFPLDRLKKITGWIKNFCRDRRMKRPLLEVSGGVTLDTVRRISRCGVDRISIGRLTHSAPILDMSLDVRPK